MPFASAAGRTVSIAASMTDTGAGRLDVEAHLAGGDAAHVEQVFDELRLHARVALDRLEPLLQIRSSLRAAPQDLRPAEDRVERRPQLVRQRGEELVLHLAHALGCGARGALALEQLLALLGGLLRAFVEARVVDRDGGLRGDADDEPLRALGEHVRLAGGRRTVRR